MLVLPATTLARIRSHVLAHHKLNSGREAAEKELLSALWRVRHPDAEDSSDRDHERADFDDRVSDLASFKMFCNAWWPAVSAPAALFGWPMSGCQADLDLCCRTWSASC